MVSSGGSGRADWEQNGYAVLRPSSDGWNESFRLPRHTYCTHAEARMIFVKETAWLGAIKDIDLVLWFSLDRGGAQQVHNAHWATADRTQPDSGCNGIRFGR